MSARVPPERYPWWVKVTTLGARTRGAMQAYLWLSVIVGIALVAFGLYVDQLYYLLIGAIGAPLSAVAYWLTIRWMDANGSWDAIARR